MPTITVYVHSTVSLAGDKIGIIAGSVKFSCEIGELLAYDPVPSLATLNEISEKAMAVITVATTMTMGNRASKRRNWRRRIKLHKSRIRCG